jgi:hypothetical protein
MSSTENWQLNARAMFQRVLIVGVLCPSSISPSIAWLTPEVRARRLSESPRAVSDAAKIRPDHRA